MEIWQLKVFLTVAPERSFSGAARILLRTQPAVSQVLRQLELEVGDSLFDRKRRRLTRAGLILAERPHRVMRLLDDAELALRTLQGRSKYTVRIGASEPTLCSLLPVISQFRESRPDANIRVHTLTCRSIASEVLDGTLDIGVVGSEEQLETELESTPLTDDDYELLMHPCHPLATQPSIGKEDLLDQVMVVLHNEPPLDDSADTAQSHSQWQTQIALPSLDAVKRAVELQLGVAFLPKGCAVVEIDTARLVSRPLRDLARAQRLVLIFRRHEMWSRDIHVFVDIAKRRIARPRRSERSVLAS